MSRPQVSIETITPVEAQLYLSKNFSTNRKATEASIARYTNQMRNGQWYLSTDAIAIDPSGELVNGQHRLQAVVRSGKAGEFIVIRDFPKQNIKCLDQGKKRMMHERITIEGMPMTGKECAIIRNAFSNYNSFTLGTSVFTDLRHDAFVVKEFTRHSKFLKILFELGYLRQTVPGFFVIGALYILLEIDYRLNKYADTRYEYMTEKYSFPALTRALQFLELSTTGTLEHTGTFKSARDLSAKTLYDAHRESKYKNKHWAGFEQLNITLSAASNFAQERKTHVMSRTKTLPFQPLTQYKSANDVLMHTLEENENFIPTDTILLICKILTE